MEIFDVDKLNLFVYFFIPGFISIKIWGLLVPTEEKKISEYLVEAVSYSCINFAILWWLIVKVSRAEFQSEHTILAYILGVSVMFIFPVIWPILFWAISRTPLYRNHFIDQTPKAWDHFWTNTGPCYVLIHMKNGKLIGGFCGYNSYASGYPHSKDVYVEKVWKIDEKGRFIEPIEGSQGLWISEEEFSYLEFFQGLKEGGKWNAEV